jgi:hypothetical protein
MDITPWGLWSDAGKDKKDDYVTQGSMTATMDDKRRHRVNEHMKGKEHDNFGRKAWLQRDRNNNAWVTTCPKEHSSLDARQFPVVCQTYFGALETCLEGLEAGAAHLTESRTDGQKEQGDSVRRIRREPS